MAFSLFVSVLSTAASAAFAAALLCIGATYTLLSAFLCLIYIEYYSAENSRKNRYNNEIFHNYLAFEAASCLFDLFEIKTITAIIATIATSPATAAPILRAAESVTRVPIVYTR